VNPARREQRRAARRQQIVDAAMRMVADDGVDALTMPGLATELGVSVGGLYRYFDGKDALLLALQLEAVDAYDRFAEQVLAAEPPEQPALSRLRAVLDSWVAFAVAEPIVYRLLEALTADPRVLLDAEGVARVQEHVDPVLERVVHLLDEAVRAGSLRPGDNLQRVYLLWGALQGVLQFRKQDRRRPPPLRSGELARVTLDSLLSGWGSAPP
jgi:AcrR family transcriptional regulator